MKNNFESEVNSKSSLTINKRAVIGRKKAKNR